MKAKTISIIPIIGIPLVETGDDLVNLILKGLSVSGITLAPDDILVISQKIVSKAEGAVVDINSYSPSRKAKRLAGLCQKDERVVELILRESKKILRRRTNLLITEHKNGYVCANAGIDYSNVKGEAVSLLPVNPDLTAETIRKRIKKELGIDVAVIITDSHGRPFRKGLIGVAIGSSGIKALVDKKGCQDLFGYQMRHTEIALVDELASTALLVMGESDEGIPAVVIRGLNYPKGRGKASDLIRAEQEDLFR